MWRKIVLSLAAAAVSLSAAASPLTYAFRATPIRAGVLLIDSQQYAGHRANWNPHVFYNLDANKALKPGGWTFYNPFASSVWTAPDNVRWSALNALSGQPTPSGGSRMTKAQAPYWEVILSQASESQLAQYDVLSLSAYGYVSLNSAEREKLRRFMEGGGVLWVDFRRNHPGVPTQGFDIVNGFPLGFNLNTANAGLTPDADVFHPLLNYPAVISSIDLLAMDSDNSYGLTDVDLTALGFPDIQNIQEPTESDYSRILPVAVETQGPKIAFGAVGDGIMVITTRGVAHSINKVVNSAGATSVNGGSQALIPSFDRNSDAAGKLVYNMVGLTASYGQSGKGARKTGNSFLDSGAPALRKFNFEQAISAPPNSFNYRPPAVFRGLVIVPIEDRIYALDAEPSRDMNGDGNPDDGIVDYSLGAEYDVVWVSQSLPTPLSGVTAVEVPNSGVVNQASVVDGTGRFLVFNAFPGVPTNNMAPAGVANAPSVPEVETGLAGGGPYQPTYHDGLYFISDQFTTGLSSVGRVWVVSASNFVAPGGGNWAVGSQTSPVFGRPSAPPTVGHIPIPDGSGGLDRVVYVATRPNVAGGPNSTAGINSLWVGVKGEKPFSFISQGGFLRVVTRAHLNGLRVVTAAAGSSLGIKLTVIDQLGNPLDAAAMNAFFDGSVTDTGGFLNIRYKPAMALPANYAIRLDYTIDWSVNSPGYGLQVLRSQVYLPDDTARRRRILGNMALSPEGTLHVVHADTGNNTTGGSYYAFVEERRGEFEMRARYELYPQHQMTLSGAPSGMISETLEDTDPLLSFVPAGILNGRFTGLTYRSGPVVHNGLVYVMARGVKNNFVPCSILMTFDANPPVPEIIVGDVPGTITLVQPDLARSDNKAVPNVYSQLSQNQFTYEAESGATRGAIRIENLMATRRGFAGTSLSLSQPVIIRRSGQPDRLLEPDSAGSRWSPLQWYAVFHGSEVQAPVFASGNTVFISNTTVLPYFIRNGFGFPPPGSQEALVYGLNSKIAPNDPFLASSPTRPWNKQLYMLKTSPTFQGNPNMRWPQSAGVQSFEDWGIRLLQTSMGANTDVALGVVGGEGSTVGWSDRGVTTFAPADYVVCDEGRVARFDASGNPVWTSDGTGQSGVAGDSGFAQTRRPLVRPTRAYPVNSRELLIVDTGANRIARVDISGRETRSIEGFILDPNVQPDGYEQGETTRLKQPRDIITYTTRPANPAGFVNARPQELWNHYLIADAGNHRLIELIDRYEVNVSTGRIIGPVRDGNNVEQLGVLYWHTGSNLNQKEYVYTGLARVFVEDTANPGTGRWVYAAGIGGTMPTRVDLGLDTPNNAPSNIRQEAYGNGGVVLFDGSNTQVVNEVVVPEIPVNAFYNFGTASFNSPLTPERVKKLGNLKSVSMRNVFDATYGTRMAIMFADSEGVWEVIQPAPNAAWRVRWMLPREAYKAMRRTLANVPTQFNARDFTPMYAKRLDNGDVLVVNGYYGKTLGNAELTGEILQLNGDVVPNGTPLNVDGFNLNRINLGFKTTSIQAELPPVQGARGIVLPVFVERR